MSNVYSKPKLHAMAILVCQLLPASGAFAAGFQINEISTSLQGDALAGAAAARDDVSAMFINPATLSALSESQGYIGASEIIPSISMRNAEAIHRVNIPGIPPSNITARVIGNDNERNISPSAFVPNGYVGYKINDKWTAGLALVAPFGLKTKYDPDSTVRFAALYSAVQTTNVNPAVAYAITDKVSIGAGLQAQYIVASFTNFNGGYTGVPPIDEMIAANYPTHLKGDSWGYGYNLGITYNPSSVTRLGLGFRSEIHERLNGVGEQYVLPGATVPAPSKNFLFNGRSSINAGVTTPQVLSIGAAHDLDNWTLKGTVQVNFWEVFDYLSINMPEAFATNSTIQTQWSNTWFGSLGAEYHSSPLWTFRGGVAYDQTPTNDTFRDPRIPDANRVWLTAGASYAMNKSFSVDAAYAHIFMQNQTVNVVQASGVSATSTLPLEVNQVSANYSGSANIVAIAMRYKYS